VSRGRQAFDTCQLNGSERVGEREKKQRKKSFSFRAKFSGTKFNLIVFFMIPAAAAASKQYDSAAKSFPFHQST